MPQLVLLRHGQSTWNAENLFTGWHDVDLTERGEAEARQSGRLLADEGELDLRVLHTSLLTRAIRTAELSLEVAGRSWLPVRRHWRLNERHYGALQGLDKKETTAQHGEARVKEWRRSYDVPPPSVEPGNEHHPAGDPRYRDVPVELLPVGECLADVVDRVLPYWYDAVVPDLLAEGARGGAVLVVAHGNSLRALRKHIDGIGDDAIVSLDIPTGIPFVYQLADDLSVVSADSLGDPEAAATAAAAVSRQAPLPSRVGRRPGAPSGGHPPAPPPHNDERPAPKSRPLVPPGASVPTYDTVSVVSWCDSESL
jgi:2,3-bisphosphoglycerate-dependent phosphoglycerate mutase